MIPYTTKVGEQAATPVSSEVHIIGILGTATYAPGLVNLVQVPESTMPSSVSIPGYNEITSGTPTGTQFLVDYTTGIISFSTSQDGNSISVSYNGLGSEIFNADINELQNPVSAVVTQTIIYNWPAAPTVSWSLAPSIVFDSNISASAAISLSKLQPLSSSVVPVTNGSGILTSSSVTATTLSYLDATSSIQTQLNGKQATGTYITDLTGDATASGPGSAVLTLATVNSNVGSFTNATITVNAKGLITAASTGTASVTSITGTANQVIASSSTGAVTLSLPQNIAITSTPTFSSETLTAISNQLILGTTTTTTISATAPVSSLTYTIPDVGMPANFVLDQGNYTISGAWEFTNPVSIGGAADPSAVLTLISTVQGFLPPRMTTTQMNAISSPAEGLEIYAIDTHQWMGWNGSSWVILG